MLTEESDKQLTILTGTAPFWTVAKKFCNHLRGYSMVIACNRSLEKQMGILAMKIPALNNIFRDDGLTTMDEVLGYALSFPVSTAIVGITSVEQVDDNVRVAR